MKTLVPDQRYEENCRVQRLILPVLLSFRILNVSCLGSSTDVVAAVGDTVTLSTLPTENIREFSWYRGITDYDSQEIVTYYLSYSRQYKGQQYTGRETALQNGSLKIRDVLTSHTGNYTVTGWLYNDTYVRGTRQMRVFEPVSVPVIQSVIRKKMKKGALVLFCNSSGTAVSYKWFKGSLEVVPKGRISVAEKGKTLTLSPCTKSDVGTTFYCRASNAVSVSSSSPYTITMNYPVSVPVIHALTMNAVENGSLVLFCNASGTAISYRWYRGTREVVSRARISLTKKRQTLTLSPCTRSDTGTIFTCRASNSISISTSNRYNVTISYGPDAPVISVSPEKPFYAAGFPLRLSCTAASYPPASYTWRLNKKSLPTIGKEMYINTLTLSDSGKYTCTTYNSVTKHSNHTSKEIRILEVMSQPTMRVSTQHPVEHRDSVVLTCDTSNTVRKILWFFNNSSLPADIRINLSANNRTLALSNVSRRHSGIYRCKAINPISAIISDPKTLTVALTPPGGAFTSHWQITLSVAISVFLITSCIFIIVFLLYKRRRKTQKDENTHKEPDRSQDSTLYYENVIHVNPKPSLIKIEPETIEKAAVHGNASGLELEHLPVKMFLVINSPHLQSTVPTTSTSQAS